MTIKLVGKAEDIEYFWLENEQGYENGVWVLHPNGAFSKIQVEAKRVNKPGKIHFKEKTDINIHNGQKTIGYFNTVFSAFPKNWPIVLDFYHALTIDNTYLHKDFPGQLVFNTIALHRDIEDVLSMIYEMNPIANYEGKTYYIGNHTPLWVKDTKDQLRMITGFKIIQKDEQYLFELQTMLPPETFIERKPMIANLVGDME